MITRALEKYLRISPKKLRPIARLLKEKRVDEALYILINTNKKGALILKGIIESALANAKRIPDKKFAEEDLYISKIVVNGGPALKRYKAMSMGRAGLIRRRTSHILIELEASKVTADKTGARKKPEKVKKLVKAGK